MRAESRLERKSFVQRVTATALSGILLGLVFPNASYVFLLPICLVPLLWAISWTLKDEPAPLPKRLFRDARRGAALGQIFGTCFWLTAIPWIAYTIHHFGGVSQVVAALGLVVATSLLALPFAAMGALLTISGPRSWSSTLVLWPAAWVLEEALRTYILDGFPWALLAYALADHPALAQTAAIGGSGLLAALVVALNAVVFLIARDIREGHRLLSRAPHALVTIGVFVGLAIWGEHRVARVRQSEMPSGLRVGVVQPNVPQSLRWDPTADERIFASLLAQTHDLAAREKPDLIFWPESASPYNWPWSETLRNELTRLCATHNTALLISNIWSDAPGNRSAPAFNAAILVTADGVKLPTYNKLRLVPFGEYVPLGRLLRMISPISRALPGEFTAGTKPRLLTLGKHRFGGMICYEVVYPWIAREHTRSGATVLFTLTNDDWYGLLGARRQHWQGAVMRAIETGRPLVRAAVTGISGVIGPEGSVRAQIGPNETASFALELPNPIPAPPAVAVGDWPLLLAGVVVGARLVVQTRRSRRR